MNMPDGMDIAVLMDAACNDQEIAATLLKLFFELTSQEQACLDNAIAQGNAPMASAVAHKVAGSCASCGMNKLAARFRELEHLCKETLPGDINERIQIITQDMTTIRIDLEKYFNCSLTP
jgi:HPt (histidine-containing phosphotransfer) domain-containing protein